MTVWGVTSYDTPPSRKLLILLVLPSGRISMIYRSGARDVDSNPACTTRPGRASRRAARPARVAHPELPTSSMDCKGWNPLALLQQGTPCAPAQGHRGYPGPARSCAPCPKKFPPSPAGLPSLARGVVWARRSRDRGAARAPLPPTLRKQSVVGYTIAAREELSSRQGVRPWHTESSG